MWLHAVASVACSGSNGMQWQQWYALVCPGMQWHAVTASSVAGCPLHHHGHLVAHDNTPVARAAAWLLGPVHIV